MRKVTSIILKVISGVFFYIVGLLGFISEPQTYVKLGILIGFLVLAAAALSSGLVLARFHNWRRDTGIVLLCASGVTVFLIFTFACLLMTEEFRKMIRPETLTFFSDYMTGCGVVAGIAVFGWILVKTNKVEAEQNTTLDADSPALQPRQRV